MPHRQKLAPLLEGKARFDQYLAIGQIARDRLKDAYQALRRDGFGKPQVQSVAADGARPDTVVGQDPPPGRVVSPDAAVRLKVARIALWVAAEGTPSAENAKSRCPAACAGADGRWTGQWRRSAQGQTWSCQCAF